MVRRTGRRSREIFFSQMGTSIQEGLGRCDGVIFFESAVVGDLAIETGNPARIESNREAVALDQKLRLLWSQHPRFRFVPHNAPFIDKIAAGLRAMERMVRKLRDEGNGQRLVSSSRLKEHSEVVATSNSEE